MQIELHKPGEKLPEGNNDILFYYKYEEKGEVKVAHALGYFSLGKFVMYLNESCEDFIFLPEDVVYWHEILELTV
jgi:hypothetical protein